MPTVLILSLYGTSFFSSPRYPTLLPSLLSRATVHESTSAPDALPYLTSSWPSVILATDPVFTYHQHRPLLERLRTWIRNGGTLVLMGLFASTVEWPDMNAALQILQTNGGLPWSMGAYSKERARLRRCVAGLRTHSLDQHDTVQGVFLQHVDGGEGVYTARHRSSARGRSDTRLACAAYGQVGFGWLGFVGDMNYTANAERLVLAMCRLDDPVVGSDGEKSVFPSHIKIPLRRRKSNSSSRKNPWTHNVVTNPLKESRSANSLKASDTMVYRRARSRSESPTGRMRRSSAPEGYFEPEIPRRGFLIEKRRRDHRGRSKEKLEPSLGTPKVSPSTRTESWTTARSTPFKYGKQ